jgi:Asp-tRNA(Asn)/Glu-tRNA(Gln) amidotransferase A subunit family amidase
MWRAHHVVMVPLSDATMASSSRAPSSWATTCGFMGVSGRVPRSSISAVQSFIPFCARSRKAAVALALEHGHERRQRAAAVAHETDLDGVAEADAHGIQLDCTPRAWPGFGKNSM